jgi:Protein of unknown function (DUF3309)
LRAESASNQQLELASPREREQSQGGEFSMLILLLVILLLLSVGSYPAWPYSRGWGYYPSGGLGVVLLILVVLLLLGRI